MTDTSFPGEHGRPSAGAGRLDVDVDSLTRLTARLAAVDTRFGWLAVEVTDALAEADAAIGVDDAARAFRTGFAGLTTDLAGASAGVARALADHQMLIARGVREIGGADDEAGLRLKSGDR
ncbi:hypothetical protein G3I13_01640 [Streptomyces sp. SID6673]|nr:hypothetical protein [Streptomyces sp. SID11726]NDZ94863.1 hypothetical protein [Streptomyces sp. SID11726]NEB23023.1 hypothetical protein [Streptomyces sp. SID6673]